MQSSENRKRSSIRNNPLFIPFVVVSSLLAIILSLELLRFTYYRYRRYRGRNNVLRHSRDDAARDDIAMRPLDATASTDPLAVRSATPFFQRDVPLPRSESVSSEMPPPSADAVLAMPPESTTIGSQSQNQNACIRRRVIVVSDGRE